MSKKINGDSVSKKYTAEQFAQEFKILCDRMGYQLVATPQWIARYDNTFSLSIRWSVGELPKQTTSIDKLAQI